ncbi:MAG: hypothetical protein B7Z10_08435 [Rhodobacterales bacterium 32-66-7]|nr:MAG: hypothetical protein B7Z10_08435 [Rhodobacterales bacterium 32-66-7]
MSVLMLLAAIAVLSVAAFLLAKRRALSSAGGNPRLLHSLARYYGWYGALSVLIPALAALTLWLLVQPMVIENRIAAALPSELVADNAKRDLTMADVRRVAGGLDVAVAQGTMTEEEAGMIRTEFTNVRDRLAAVGVALGFVDVGGVHRGLPIGLRDQYSQTVAVPPRARPRRPR